MTDHTKEPWLCDKRTVYALNKNGFNTFSAVVQDCHTSNSELEANARRIVACVNACECIETDELNAYRVVSSKEHQEIERQRDELLSLLESFGHKMGCGKNAFGDTCTCGVDDVIASVKGGAE